jgi:hypothetical protein
MSKDWKMCPIMPFFYIQKINGINDRIFPSPVFFLKVQDEKILPQNKLGQNHTFSVKI